MGGSRRAGRAHERDAQRARRRAPRPGPLIQSRRNSVRKSALRHGRRHAGDRRPPAAPRIGDAAEKELAAMFGGNPADVGQCSARRRPALQPQGRHDRLPWITALHAAADRGQARCPRVRGINVKGRVAVFYSREDLSAGMVGQPVDGITGYTPERPPPSSQHPPLRRRGEVTRPGAHSPLADSYVTPNARSYIAPSGAARWKTTTTTSHCSTGTCGKADRGPSPHDAAVHRPGLFVGPPAGP